MGLKEWIIPQDKHFFNMLENESRNVLDGSNAFLDMLKIYENIKDKQQKIKDIEHQGTISCMRYSKSSTRHS